MADQKIINSSLKILPVSNGVSFDSDGTYTRLNADAVLRIGQRVEVWGGGNTYNSYLDVRNTSGVAQHKFNAEGDSYILTDVGIGMTSPGQKLDVAGNIKMTETAATTDTDKFVVLDSGVLKYRTGSQVISDLPTDTRYVAVTGDTMSGNLDVNADIQSNTFTQAASGIPRNNLGSPTVTEMALFDSQFTPKTTLANGYDDLTYLTFWVQTTSSSAWTEVTTYSDDQKRRFLRTTNSSVIIPNGAYKFRVEFRAKNYTFANALYGYWSSNSHKTKVHIYKYNQLNSAWTQHTSSSTEISSWPGHMYLPFSTIAWHETNTTSSGHYRDIRIEFTPTWVPYSGSGTDYSGNNINIYGLEIWGGYPSGRRTPHYYDQDGVMKTWESNVFFHDGYHPNADTWTTGRTITIGGTGKTVDGSDNVSWTLSEIGAAASSHNHDGDYVNVGGDTMTGLLIAENGIRIGTGDHYTDGRASLTFGEGNPTGDSMYIEYDGENLSGDNNAIFIGSNKAGVGDVLAVSYGGNVQIPNGNLTVAGNLTVGGTTTTLNTETIEVEDNILQLNTTQGTPDTATAATSGISIYRGDGVTQASFIFDDGDDTWDLTNNLVVAGTITGSNLSGTNTGDQDLSGYALTSHSHDDRYYTETEVDEITHQWEWRWQRWEGLLSPASESEADWTSYYKTYFTERTESIDTSYPPEDNGYINTKTNVGALGGFGGSTYGNIFGNLSSYHTLIYTNIYVDKEFTVNVTTFNGDDPHAIFIDGKFVRGSIPCCSNKSYSYTFKQGWHRIDLIYSEGGGGDYITMGWNPKDYTDYISQMHPHLGSENPNYILNKLKEIDGPGSGLDADTLDGQEGTYYLDYANFTSTPNLGTAASSAATDFVAVTGDTMTGQLSINKTGSSQISVNSRAYFGTHYDNNDVWIYGGPGDNILLGGGIGNIQNDVNVGNGDLIVPNGDVGIGTTSPDNLLEIETTDGATGSEGIFVKDVFAGTSRTVSSPDPFISIGTADFSGATSTIYLGEDATATGQETKIEYDRDSDTLGIFAKGQGTYREHVRFGNPGSTDPRTYFSGEVGIGTTSPAGKLNVVAGNNGTALFLEAEDGANSYKNITFKTYVSEAQAANFPDGSHIYTTSPGGATTWPFTEYGALVIEGRDNTNGGIALRTGGGAGQATRIAIREGGDVGIGTTSPRGKLDVNSGEVYVTTPSGMDALKISDADVKIGDYDDANGYAFLHLDTEFKFTTDSTEAMRIAQNGNVGIGETNPGEKLSVAPDTDVSAEIGKAHIGQVGFNDYAGFSHVDTNSQGSYALLQNSSGLTYLNASAGQSIRFRINNSDKMILDSLGNVGIGMTSPVAKLDINDSSNDVSLTSTANYAINTGGAINAGHYKNINLETPQMEWSIGGGTDLDWKKLATIVINDANYAGFGAEVEITDFSGNYGNSMAEYGDVYKGGLSIYHRGGDGVEPKEGIITIHSDMLPYIRIYKIAGSGNSSYQIQVKSTANYRQIYVKLKGGIGNQVASITPHANDTNGSTTGGTAYTPDAYTSGNQFKAAFPTVSANKGIILDKLSVNLTSPAGKFDVRTDSSFGNCRIIIPETTNQNPVLAFYRPTGSAENAYPWHLEANGSTFQIKTGTSANIGSESVSAKVTINSSGNVGIGQTNPSAYKLDVTGTIRATGDVIAYSDIRVKENIKTINNALDKVKALRGVEYNKIDNPEKSIGVIAQEIEEVIPEVVREDDQGMKSVAYGNITAVLIEAIKEQQKQIDELKKQLDAFTK